MKKIIWIICIVLCCSLALGLAACGDKDKNQGDATTSNDTQASTGDNQSSAGDNQPVVQLAEFEGITFASNSVEYDGDAHAITAIGVPEGATVTYTKNIGTDVGTYNATATISKEGYKTLTLNATLDVTLPTAQSVVDARTNAKHSAVDNYDFQLKLSGTVNLMGYSGTANANYDGKYRYNADTGELQFTRTTGGMLLYDATEYIAVQGDSKLKVTANDKGVVKNINVMAADDEELLLINKPVEALVDALKASELTNIALAGSGNYMFKANVKLTADNALLNKALAIISKQGTSISFKGATFTNPVSGLVLYFNMTKDKKLNDFALSAEISVPVSPATVTLTLNYSQVGSSSAITLPALGSVIIDKTAIASELATINNAIQAVKTSADYSLDLEAKNQFDPGWNVRATTDKYTARMYKHTYTLDDADFVAFNHSYEYKTHHEEDGAETYKYTVGNIKDGTVHLVSRKGSNTITDMENVSADTQFDWLTEAFTYTADEVDCIRKETKGSTVTYALYLNNASTVAVNQKVSDMINSNDAEGVIAVDNYFDDSDYDIKESSLTIVLNSGKLGTVEAETEIKYNPTAGEYTQKRITLTDNLTLAVNQNLTEAKKYEAPKSTTTSLGSYGLNNAKFYIL